MTSVCYREACYYRRFRRCVIIVAAQIYYVIVISLDNPFSR